MVGAFLRLSSVRDIQLTYLPSLTPKNALRNSAQNLVIGVAHFLIMIGPSSFRRTWR